MINIVRGHIKQPTADKYAIPSTWKTFASVRQSGSRKKRQKLGVSQEEFADICGLDRSTRVGLSAAKGTLGWSNVEKLAKALRFSLPECFGSLTRTLAVVDLSHVNSCQYETVSERSSTHEVGNGIV